MAQRIYRHSSQIICPQNRSEADSAPIHDQYFKLWCVFILLTPFYAWVYSADIVSTDRCCGVFKNQCECGRYVGRATLLLFFFALTRIKRLNKFTLFGGQFPWFRNFDLVLFLRLRLGLCWPGTTGDEHHQPQYFQTSSATTTQNSADPRNTDAQALRFTCGSRCGPLVPDGIDNLLQSILLIILAPNNRYD